jgi:hypothetical protein
MQKSASLQKVIHERNAEQILIPLTARLGESDIKLRDLELRSTRQ